MEAQKVIRLIVYICRAIQLPVALIALGLTASLIPTFRQLDNECVTELDGIKCSRFSETLGGLRFSIGTAVLALVDVVVGSISLRITQIPWWVVLTLDSVTAGFYMGSGSTIAARLNGEFCKAGPSDPDYACGRLFADMGFSFVGAIVCYAVTACGWTSRARQRHSCSAPVADEHPLQDPFQDPPNTQAGAGHGELNKRRSWSQLS